MSPKGDGEEQRICTSTVGKEESSRQNETSSYVPFVTGHWRYSTSFAFSATSSRGAHSSYPESLASTAIEHSASDEASEEMSDAVPSGSQLSQDHVRDSNARASEECFVDPSLSRAYLTEEEMQNAARQRRRLEMKILKQRQKAAEKLKSQR